MDRVDYTILQDHSYIEIDLQENVIEEEEEEETEVKIGINVPVIVPSTPSGMHNVLLKYYFESYKCSYSFLLSIQ